MRQVWLAVRQYVSIILAAALLLIGFIYIQLSRLPFEDDQILYGLILFYQSTGLYVTLLTLASLCIWIVRAIFRIRQFNVRHTFITLAAGILLFVAVPITCWGNIKLFAEMGVDFSHVSQVRIQSHLYQLALIWNWNLSNQRSYNIYQCDSIGIACDRIDQIALPEEVGQSVDELHVVRMADLVADPNTQTLSIQVNGEIIHTVSI